MARVIICNDCCDLVVYVKIALFLLLCHQLQDSNTALHIAAKLGNTEAVKALLRGGANPHLMNVVSVFFRPNLVYELEYMCALEGK